jgi:hypothetical protein
MYCDVLTFCDLYVLEILPFESLTFRNFTFSDARLSDINVVLCYVLSQYHRNFCLSFCLVNKILRATPDSKVNRCPVVHNYCRFALLCQLFTIFTC